MNDGISRIKLEGFFILNDRFLKTALISQGQPQVSQSLGAGRDRHIQLDRLVDFTDRLVKKIDLVIINAQIVMGFRVIRVDLKRFPDFTGGFFAFPHLEESHPQLKMGHAGMGN